MINLEDMYMEYIKCYQDKSRIYFIEHYLSTFNADVRKSTPFLLFPRQKVFLQTVATKPNTIAIKHRQCGITTVSSAWVTGQFVFCEPDSKETVLAVANKMDLAVQIVDKIREFLLQVPRWFWGEEYYSPDPKSEKNKKDIFVKNSKQELELFNGCKVHARSSGENAARGISAASILIFDEAAFIENSTAVYASAVAASASVKDAKIIMVSTPNGKDALYYNTYRKAILGENNFTPVEFRWFQDLRYNRNLAWYKKNEKTGEIIWDKDTVIDERGNIQYDEERWRNLERNGWKPTSPWYNDMCMSFNNDSMKIAQELDVSFMGSSNNVVQPEVIEMQEKLNVREPLTDFKDPFIEETWFWKKPIDGHRYLISCLPENELIKTDNGIKPIQEVTFNDNLINKDGLNDKIVRIIKHYVDENIYSIKLDSYHTPIRFTKNHPIYVALDKNEEFKFLLASEVKKGMWVRLPNYYVINNNLEFDYNINFIKNEDFWWFCGLWLSSHLDEPFAPIKIKINNDFSQKALKKIRHIFNENSIIEYDKDIISIYNEELKEKINEFFYKNKKLYISEKIKFLRKNYLQNFLEGFFLSKKIKNNKIIINHKSREIIDSIQDILYNVQVISKTYITNIGYELEIENETLSHTSNNDNCYISDDGKFIYFKITDISINAYKGFVYNFETETHTFCTNRFAVHNCDNSSGSSEDRTAIEIIDMDGIDENGMPIIEQVAEYNGKKYGDEIGEILFQYGNLYNQALIVVEDCGGYGSATLLTLMNLGYKNLFYDDPNLSKYTANITYSKLNMKEGERLPGFRNNSVRFQMLSGFAMMLRNNEFKVRSKRVIMELETWIFKGENGRMDHMDGQHDDTITCLAMGLFVMKYSFNKMESIKSKDKAILKSYIITNSNSQLHNTSRSQNSYSIAPKEKRVMPFYTKNSLYKSKINGSYMWLFTKTK